VSRLLEALKRIESSQTSPPEQHAAVAEQNRPPEDSSALPGLADDTAQVASAEKLPAADLQLGPIGSHSAAEAPVTYEKAAGEAAFELSIVAAPIQASCVTETVYSAPITHVAQDSSLGRFSETLCAAAPSVQLPEPSQQPALTDAPGPPPTPGEHPLSQSAELATTPPLAEQPFAPDGKWREAGGPDTDATHARAVQPSEQRYDILVQRPQEERHAHFGRQALAVMPHGDPRQVAFGNLATQIISQLACRFPAAIVFTSPTDRTGTTRTLLPLADALSRQMGGRLLLIDADYLKADLTARGRVYDHRGLWDAIHAPGQWRQIVCRTDLHGVFLLPGARHCFQADASDALGFRTLLHELLQDYRLVVVDAPSLAHEGAVLLARQCEGLYLVARLQYTSARALEEAVRLLRNQHVRLLGCVVLEA